MWDDGRDLSADERDAQVGDLVAGPRARVEGVVVRLRRGEAPPPRAELPGSRRAVRTQHLLVHRLPIPPNCDQKLKDKEHSDALKVPRALEEFSFRFIAASTGWCALRLLFSIFLFVVP